MEICTLSATTWQPLQFSNAMTSLSSDLRADPNMSRYNDGEDVEQQQRLIDGDDSEQCDGRTPVRFSFTAQQDIFVNRFV